MRKRPDRRKLSALDQFADQASMYENKTTSKQDDMSSSKHVEVKSEILKLVSTRVPVDLIDRLQRIAAHTELSIQDVIIAGVGGNSENGKNRTLSDQQRSASDLNRRVCGVSPHQAFQLHSGLEFFLLGRGDLCGQLDLEIAQSIGLTGGNPKTTSLSTAPLAYDFFRFLRRPLLDL